MKYFKGFKYQTAATETYQSLINGYSVDTDYYSLTPTGLITAKKGFAWDGCTKAIDTKRNRRASLFHDIGCLMIARGELPLDMIGAVNNMFLDILKEDAGNKFYLAMAWVYYKAVTLRFATGRPPKRREVINLEFI